MKKVLSLSLILFDLFQLTFAAEESSLEGYRAGNIYEKIDPSTFPSLQSAQDCYQLGFSLIQSEINFWQDSQRSLLEENQRLRIIVNLLCPSSSPKQEGKPLLSDFKSKLANLELRARILINPNDPSDTTNKDLFDIYNSYSTIVEDLKDILELYENHRISDMPSTSQEQNKFLVQIRDAILKESQKIEQHNFLKRGLIQNNTIGMNISRICHSQKGQLQSELPDIFGKYAFCDVEYVTQIFIPTIAQLFDTTQRELEKLQQPTLLVSGKKKIKKKPKKYIKASSKPIVPNQPLTTPTTQVIDQEPVLVIEVPSDIPSSKAQQLLKKEESITLPQETPGPSVPNILVSENVETQSSVSHSEPNIKSGIDIISDILSPQEAASDATYSMKPWEAYQDKESSTKKHQRSQLPEALSLTPTFVLNEKYALTARILLGMGNASQEKVTMSAYQQLITKGLNGAVIDRKKCIYFMARSVFTQQWCSVAMHRLHQDDPHIIPYGTRYWKIARQLLLDVGLNESGL